MKHNPQNTGGDKPRHQRRSIRLKGYDYSLEGAYFITICCQDRKCRFGKIAETSPANRRMELNEYGIIAHDEWIKLRERFLNFELDVFQIMPNHMHGIIVLTKSTVGATLAVASNEPAVVPNKTVIPTEPIDPENPVNQNNLFRSNKNVFSNESEKINTEQLKNTSSTTGTRVNPAPTVGNIVGAYKSLVANACLEKYKSKNQTMGKFWQRNYYEHIIRDEQSHQNISNYIINNPSNWENDKFYNHKI